MNWLRGLAVLSALGFLGLLATGFLMPKEYTATASLHVDQPPEKVWAVLADYPAQAKWRPELKAVERQKDLNGHAVWKEVFRSDDTVSFEILEAQAPKRLVKQTIAKEKDDPVGVWAFDVAPDRGGSNVTITEKGAIASPMFRLMVRFMFGENAFVNGYMESLAKKLGTTYKAAAAR